MEEQRRLQIRSGEITLSAVVHLPQKIPAPVMVLCHGLLSLKESPKFIALGEELSRNGFCALRFDFSACGESPPRPGQSLVGARRMDLESVLDFVPGQQWSDGRIGLLGSSLGGYLSILAANANPERIHAIVAWAAPFDISRIISADEVAPEFSHILPDGLELGEPQNLEAVENISRTLLIHGQQDEIVDWKHAVQIYSRLKDPKKLLLMRTADHKITDESWRRAAMDASIEWLLKYFSEQ